MHRPDPKLRFQKRRYTSENRSRMSGLKSYPRSEMIGGGKKEKKLVVVKTEIRTEPANNKFKYYCRVHPPYTCRETTKRFVFRVNEIITKTKKLK